MITLLVRIEKVLARAGKLNRFFYINDIVIDVENHSVSKGDIPIELTPLEFDVLSLFVRNINRTISREQLLNEI